MTEYSSMFDRRLGLILKFNKWHDERGRFTSAKNATSTGRVREYVSNEATVGVTRDKKGVLRFDDNGKPVPKDLADKLTSFAETRSTGDKRLTGIRLNTNPNAALQVIGYRKNALGKNVRVYVYSAKVLGKNKAAKHARASTFDRTIKKFKASIAKDLKSPNERLKQSAEIAQLIATSGIRVGNSRGRLGKVKAYGATTLEARHVTITGKTATLKFPGKKGVKQNHTIDDPLTVAILKRAKARAKKSTDQIFPNADEQAVLSYVKKATGNKAFMTKDMRTWHGTAKALETMSSMPRPMSAAAYKKAKAKVAETVGKTLGNGANMALTHYIDPLVWQDWEDGLP